MSEPGCDAFPTVSVGLCGDADVGVPQCHRRGVDVAVLVNPTAKFFSQDMDRLVAFDGMIAQPRGQRSEVRLATITIPTGGLWFQVGLNHEVSGGAGPVSSKDAHQLRVDLDDAIGVFGFSFEVFGVFDPDLVGVPLERRPFQKIDFPTPKSGHATEQKNSRGGSAISRHFLKSQTPCGRFLANSVCAAGFPL